MSLPARLHYHHSLDTPLPVRALEGVVRLKGWCFSPGGDARPQIQLRIGSVTLTTLAGTDRADVAAAFPSCAHALHSGFELAGHVPAGLSVAELWAGHDGFGWEFLTSFSVHAEGAVLHGAIDLPTDRTITASTGIDGWCFHPQREIAELWLHYGQRQVRCRHYGHTRNDVAGQFPQLPHAAGCGFSTDAILPPGQGRIRLRAVDRDGGVYFCETDRTIAIPLPPSIHTGSDPRLDGRALFRAYSGRQAQLPALRVIATAPAPDELPRLLAALDRLPGDHWQLLVLSGGKLPAPLLASANHHPRVSFVHTIPEASSPSWDLPLAPGAVPVVHGVMAALLTAADHPELDAITGDFSSGENWGLHRQPPWSRTLALAGGMHACTPVLHRSGAKIAAGQPAVTALALARLTTTHIAAVLTHHAATPASATTPTASPLPKNFRRPTLTALVLGHESNHPRWRDAFSGEVDQWVPVGEATTAQIAKAVHTATSELLVLLPAGTRPASPLPLTRLAAQIDDCPACAAVPLLLQTDGAPWKAADFFTDRTRRTLAAFDPAFALWTNPALTLFSRQAPYIAAAGLMISRQRLQQLGGFDPLFPTITAALLDLAFRLRHAGTPPALSADVRLIVAPADPAISSFEETLLLDRWDQDDANPLRIRPLVPVEVLA